MRPRILFVTNNAAHPPRSGGTQRTALLLRALRGLADVDLFYIDRFRAAPDRLRTLREEHGMIASVIPWADPGTWLGRARFVLNANLDQFAPLTVSMARVYAPEARTSRRLSEVMDAGRYDLIVGRYLRATTFAGALDHPPVILDLDDHDVVFYTSRLAAPGVSVVGRLAARRAQRQLHALVPRLLARCAHVWVSNPHDVALVHEVPVSILPNVPFAPFEYAAVRPASPGGPILLVGSLDYDVNARAVDRFVHSVWPQIQAVCPGARLRIVGSGMRENQRRRWGAIVDVEPVGPVADLEAEYAAAAFAVAPVFEGGGTKIRVLEALRHERAIVVTEHAHSGYEHVLRDGESLLVGADETAFAAACSKLWHDPALATRLAKQGAVVVSEHYSFDVFRGVVTAAVERVLATTAARA